jgi:hypothetical protein
MIKNNLHAMTTMLWLVINYRFKIMQVISDRIKGGAVCKGELDYLHDATVRLVPIGCYP